MAFNYLQTDDRDDYLSQFETKRTYRRFCLKKEGEKEWSKWMQKFQMIGVISKDENSNFTRKELKKLSMIEIQNILINLGYKIHTEKIPYCSGYPRYSD